MMYKYCLIVSQYYHSRHMFIVAINDDFIDKARKCADELMRYKRNQAIGLIYLGDLDEKYCGEELRCRYNINDEGDIYFINAGYASRLMRESWEYKEDSRRESAGFKKKEVTQAISEHHDYRKIYEIVEKHFTIA